MSAIHVCPLSRLAATVEAAEASHVVTLIGAGTVVMRPLLVKSECHLLIRMSDIVAPLDGHILPAEEHVDKLVEFVRAWPREKPMVIHCFAGISRSTAAALVAACVVHPERDPLAIATRLREVSPSATPNIRFIEVADARLGYGGRLVTAAAGIGRGQEAFEAEPFILAFD
ncbi:tyrosine phosphatase family protein [Chelatococcus sp. GCM10030263]|uniref:tyrosine phosphatase family protein n=1 Tax=Chelatococcus sp. GCM10030263 TaxID=3273387 RepID=UPI00360C1B6F